MGSANQPAVRFLAGGSVLFCSVQFSSVLFSSVQFCSVLFCSVLFCSVLFCLVQFGSVWFSLVQFGSVWFSLVQFGSVWFSLVQFGSVWFSLVQFGSVWSSLVRFVTQTKTQPSLSWRICYPDCGSNFTVSTPLPPLKYMSTHRIVTWSLRGLWSSGRYLTSRFPICDPTDIRWVAVKKGHIFSEICGYSIATQRILVGSHIWDWEVKEWVDLHNLCTDHIMIRSELKYLIGGIVVMLKCRVFGGETGPFPVGRVFRVVRPVATVQFRVEPQPEPTREFGPVANTIHAILFCSESCDCNKDQYDRRNAFSLWNPMNHWCESMAPSLLQTWSQVTAAPKFDCPNCQIL